MGHWLGRKVNSQQNLLIFTYDFFPVKQYQSAHYSSYQGTCSFWSSCHCVLKQKTSVRGYAQSVRRHVEYETTTLLLGMWGTFHVVTTSDFSSYSQKSVISIRQTTSHMRQTGLSNQDISTDKADFHRQGLGSIPVQLCGTCGGKSGIGTEIFQFHNFFL
jgi:hypothetical protein